MTTYRDEELNAWAEVYHRLEAQYGILSTHRVSFELFLDNPAHNEQYIHIYFANRALLMDRAGGGCVLLPVFLDNGPQYMLVGAMVLAQLRAEDRPEWEELLPRQRRARDLIDFVERFRAQEEQDRRMGVESMVAVHDNRYIQPMKHFEPTAKWKSRGGAHL